MIVDCALYRDGIRTKAPERLSDLFAICHDGDGDEIGWMGMFEPTAEEFDEVARAFDLHELAVEDAIKAHQRPKLERYGDMVFLVLRPATYFDETERVEFGEVHVFAGPRYVITVRHGAAPQLHRVRLDLEMRPDLLRLGPVAIIHAILDVVVDDYAPVVAGIENDIDEIEDELFGATGDASRRIYELTREVIEFQRAVKPLVGILERLVAEPKIHDEERRHIRDVLDHALRVEEKADGFRDLLQSLLNVNLTLEAKALSKAGVAQNEEMKKISAWAAILFAPTLVAAVYGMNFRDMPELGWAFGYPLAIALMVAVCAGLYLMFRRRDWI